MDGQTNAKSPEREFQEIEHALNVHKNVGAALYSLGSLFHSSENRSSPAARNLIPDVVQFCEDYEMDVLRVLINFTADNTENRRFLLSDEETLTEFWAESVAREPVEINHDEGVEGEEESARFLTLIKQFIFDVDDDEMREFMLLLVQKNVVSWVFDYHEVLRTTSDGRKKLTEATEFLVEYARICPELINWSQFYKGISGFMGSIDPRSEYKDTESFLMHADYLLYCTSVEDSTENFPIEELEQLFIEVPHDCDKRLDIIRRLFAACGNIYSFPSYNNWHNLAQKVSNICGEWDFLISCSAISLGNCVSSKEIQSQLISKIDNEIEPIASVAQSLFQHRFGDVVYYQAYHFFNNVMDTEMATGLFLENNALVFAQNTKVIVDNFPYYKEIGHLYLKFVRKLVAYACVDKGIDAMIFYQAWEFLLELDEATEVMSLILEALIKHPSSYINPTNDKFYKSLFTRVMKLGNSVDIKTILQQIKTLSMVFKHHNAGEISILYGPEQFEHEFLPQLSAFLRQLEQAISNQATPAHGAGNAQTTAQNTLCNNARFLAVVAQQNLQAMSKYYESAIADVCDVTGRLVGKSRLSTLHNRTGQ